MAASIAAFRQLGPRLGGGADPVVRRSMATIDVTIREALNMAMDEEMERDDRVSS